MLASFMFSCTFCCQDLPEASFVWILLFLTLSHCIWLSYLGWIRLTVATGNQDAYWLSDWLDWWRVAQQAKTQNDINIIYGQWDFFWLDYCCHWCKYLKLMWFLNVWSAGHLMITLIKFPCMLRLLRWLKPLHYGHLDLILNSVFYEWLQVIDQTRCWE